MPWRRERLPTPVFWPEEFHGLYSPWDHKESDTTERLSLSLALKLSVQFGKQFFSLKHFLVITVFIKITFPNFYNCTSTIGHFLLSPIVSTPFHYEKQNENPTMNIFMHTNSFHCLWH